jgi:hypothetical protein
LFANQMNGNTVCAQTQPAAQALTIPDFDGYWQPFLGGQGPAPGYTLSLNRRRPMA